LRKAPKVLCAVGNLKSHRKPLAFSRPLVRRRELEESRRVQFTFINKSFDEIQRHREIPVERPKHKPNSKFHVNEAVHSQTLVLWRRTKSIKITFFARWQRGKCFFAINTIGNLGLK